jgi:hypothetical protein
MTAGSDIANGRASWPTEPGPRVFEPPISRRSLRLDHMAPQTFHQGLEGDPAAWTVAPILVHGGPGFQRQRELLRKNAHDRGVATGDCQDEKTNQFVGGLDPPQELRARFHAQSRPIASKRTVDACGSIGTREFGAKKAIGTLWQSELRAQQTDELSKWW